VSPEQFRSIATMKRASGLSAIVRQQTGRLSSFVPLATDCLVGLSRIQSAGNLGALVRTAAAFRAKGFVLIGQSIDPTDPFIVRASMGAFFRQHFLRCTWPEFAAWKQQHRTSVVGACPSGERIRSDTEWARPTVLMLGDERKGLSSRQRKHCDRLVRIPMADDSDSLNLAVAGSILLYDMMANRRMFAKRASQSRTE